MCLVAENMGILKGISVLSSGIFMNLGFEDIIVLTAFWLVLLMGLMKIEIYNSGIVAVL